MTLARRCAFWTSLALLTAVFMAWLVCVPYQPRRLFEAIPANAMLVADVTKPGVRLSALFADPAASRLALSLGLPKEFFDALAHDRDFQRYLELLAARRAVLAYLPHLYGTSGPDAWVFASWIGGQSQRLRWQAGLGLLPGLRKAPFADGDIVLVAPSIAGVRQRLSLAISEGLLLGCWSASTTGAHTLLETIDGRAGHPSVATVGRWAAAGAIWPDTSVVRGWLDFDGAEAPPIAWALTQADATRISGEFACALPLPLKTGDPAAQRVPAEALAPLLGNAVDAVALLPAALLRQFIPEDAAEAIESLGFPLGCSNILAFAVLDNAHSGHLRGPLGSALPPGLKGLKTPTALAGVWLGAEAALDPAALQTALRHWNKRWRTGLHLHPINPAVASEGVRFEEAFPGLYNTFEPDEQAAMVATNGWRIASSHAGALRACFAAGAADSTPLWRNTGARHPGAAGWFWLNPAGFSQNMRGLLAVIAMTTGGGDAFAVATRRLTDNISSALGVLDDMPGAEGWLELAGKAARLHWTIDRRN